MIRGNVFKYSEGNAIQFSGVDLTFTDNLMEWNGFHGIDGPATCKIAPKSGNNISWNLLRYNGHVSGIFMGGPTGYVGYNWVQDQNYGGLQNNGAGIHVPIKGQSSLFEGNWIMDGHHSLMIRFDTATSTTLAQVGRGGTIRRNVGWGSVKLVVKGENHTVEENTVADDIQIVRAFGLGCGMNMETIVRNNLAGTLSGRGSCENVTETLPNQTYGNVVGNLCPSVRDCRVNDFRPVGVLAGALGE